MCPFFHSFILSFHVCIHPFVSLTSCSFISFHWHRYLIMLSISWRFLEFRSIQHLCRDGRCRSEKQASEQKFQVHKRPHALCDHLMQQCPCDLQNTRSTTHLKCCASHQNWIWTSLKCCIWQENKHHLEKTVQKYVACHTKRSLPLSRGGGEKMLVTSRQVAGGQNM